MVTDPPRKPPPEPGPEAGKVKKARRRMSRSILLAARQGGRREKKPPHSEERVTIGEILADLGDRSFGWCLFVFTIISLLPLPIGSNMITAIPVIWIAGQMAAGYRYIHLPRFMTGRSFKRRSVRATVHKLRFVMRPLERIAHPRRADLFTPRSERLVGMGLLVFALALFLPIPLSGYGPAISIFICSLGLVERDGVILLLGLAAGCVALLITSAMGGLIVWELIQLQS